VSRPQLRLIFWPNYSRQAVAGNDQRKTARLIEVKEIFSTSYGVCCAGRGYDRKATTNQDNENRNN
jgi:hypothetical protein